jgi:hypothetical protein
MVKNSKISGSSGIEVRMHHLPYRVLGYVKAAVAALPEASSEDDVILQRLQVQLLDIISCLPRVLSLRWKRQGREGAREGLGDGAERGDRGMEGREGVSRGSEGGTGARSRERG